jgi:C-terminal processing protease CtpA/Prc
MRRLRHATIVGEITRGGSHMSRWVTVHPNFAISIPVARHVEPARDWEGVGITPDVATTEAEALRSAHLLALQALR